MNRIQWIAALLLFMHFSAYAQTAPPADLVTIEQSFEKLECVGQRTLCGGTPR